MDIVYKKFLTVLKVIIALILINIFIKVFPMLVVVGIAGWGIVKLIKYIKNSNKNFINNTKQKVSNTTKDDDFDLNGKKVVDVEYEDICSDEKNTIN